MRNNKYLYITLLTMLAMNAEAQVSDSLRQVPRLVVDIAIDQLRSDYLEAFAPLYGDKGFKRLFSEGRVYEHASHPYLPVDRASAIATMASGTTPSYHGIVGERWLNRETLRPVYCTDDPKQPYQSPSRLAVSTLPDELEMATDGKAQVYSIAPTQDAAILSAGHAADGAIWKAGENGRWTTSTYYSNYQPLFLLNFNELKNTNKVRRRRQKKQSLLPSPNTEITELALSCANAQKLGRDTITDMLCLHYDAGCPDGQTLTNWQESMKDTYVQLDSLLGHLMTQLDDSIGRGQVFYVVTSTGTIQSEAPAYETYRIPTGTFYINRAANLLNMYFGALWGQGRYVEGTFGNQLFLNHKLLETKRIALSEAARQAQEFIAQMEGIRTVYTYQQFLNGTDNLLRLLRNGYHLQRQGEIQVEVNPGWHIQNEETHDDLLPQMAYVPFPIILMGAQIPEGRVEKPVTTDRIAPTIAKAIRIRAPNACSSEPLF